MNSYNTKNIEDSQPEKLTKAMDSKGVFAFWKHPGETLAVLLRRFREEEHFDNEEKITYAGRLDPMAEGVVPLLVGDARFQKDYLLGAVKVYEVDVLLGVGTDTADMLGFMTKVDFGNGNGEVKGFSVDTIESAIREMKEITELPSPEYSSRPVDGKPLFMHARAGQKVVVPIKKVVIYALELKEIKELPLAAVLDGAIEVIKKVQGDFRQQETIEGWQKLKEQSGNQKVQVVSIVTTVSSGTYMRSLAERMGELLGVPALASRIVRTEVKGIIKARTE
jgi:tRNA pseudouridine55 synthase